MKLEETEEEEEEEKGEVEVEVDEHGCSTWFVRFRVTMCNHG